MLKIAFSRNIGNKYVFWEQRIPSLTRTVYFLFMQDLYNHVERLLIRLDFVVRLRLVHWLSPNGEVDRAHPSLASQLDVCVNPEYGIKALNLSYKSDYDP